jgi:rhamnulose-1-phosphate aldolase
VHNDHVGRRELEHHAIVHAQPIHLTYLSHLAQYQDTERLNRRLLRGQPETIVEFTEGFALLPWEVPGSPEQMGVTTAALASYRAIVWARHGIVTRADKGAGKAADLVEYAEAAARYEYMNLAAGEPGQGLSHDELRLICERLSLPQPEFLATTAG